MNVGRPLGGFFAVLTSGVIPLTLLLVGCGSDPGAQAEESASAEVPHNVRVLELRANDLQEYLTIRGPVRAKRATDVSTEETGVVQSLPRDKGALVHKNDVLVLLDRELLEAQKRSAEATLDLQEYNETRIRKLQQAKSVSEGELREVETLLEQSRQAAEIARLRYERAAVKAPFDGVVADRYVEVGQLVAAGSPVARVVDPFVLTLEGWVTEKDVRWAREGVSALVALDSEDTPVEGTVRWVSIEADPKTGKFAVEIDVPNSDLQLHLGVVGRARVVKTVHENVIAIPRDALVESPTGSAVYVVDGDRAQPREVVLGSDQGVMVVVRRGLAAGDRLVVRGQRELSPGSLVHVQEVAENPDGTISTDPVVVRREVDSPVRADMERSSRLKDDAP